MEKIKDERSMDGFYKKYYRDNEITFTIDSLVESNPDVSFVSAEDMGDVGMRTFGGRYSFDEFAELYPDIRLKLANAIFYFNNKDIAYFDRVNDIATLTTSNSELELEDLLQKKTIGGK